VAVGTESGPLPSTAGGAQLPAVLCGRQAGQPDRRLGRSSKRPNSMAGSEIGLPTSGQTSTAHVHHDFIAACLKLGPTASRIWQDLVGERAHTGGYLTVQRYVRRTRRARAGGSRRDGAPPGKQTQMTSSEARRWCGWPCKCRPGGTGAAGPPHSYRHDDGLLRMDRPKGLRLDAEAGRQEETSAFWPPRSGACNALPRGDGMAPATRSGTLWFWNGGRAVLLEFIPTGRRTGEVFRTRR
jgi:hypothetical protein